MPKKNKKIVKVNLKYEYPNHDKIHENYDYPIRSFLNNDGHWSYTDVDLIYIRNQGYSVDFVCHNNGTKCHTMTATNFSDKCGYNECKVDMSKDYYNPSIKPTELLNINAWTKIYYYQEGANEWKEWIIIFKHKNGYYAYFRASCDYTGFECQGGGQVSFSKNRNKFWNFGLDQIGRNLLLDKCGIKMKINMINK